MNIFASILSESFVLFEFLICCLASVILGFVIAAAYMYKNKYSSSFVITLAILPLIVQTVILLVNGNLGTAVAVMGAFSLVRFRSAPGSAREICSIFLAMAIGLATDTGYITIAVIITLIVLALNIFYTAIGFGQTKKNYKTLTVIIPESLDYENIFEDILKKYTAENELLEVRTTNLGSLYKLKYKILLTDNSKVKSMIDEIRTRNGNLDVICSRPIDSSDEL